MSHLQTEVKGQLLPQVGQSGQAGQCSTRSPGGEGGGQSRERGKVGEGKE